MAGEEAERPERPGPQHEFLMRRAGRYTHVTTIRKTPGAEPQTFQGEAVFTPVLGGRFLSEERSMQNDGEPVQYLKLHGYNAATDRHESMWVFNLKTAMLLLTGVREDGGRTIRWSGSYADGEEGEVTIEAATRQVDEDHFVLKVFGTAPDGAKYTVQETSYARES